MIRTEGRKVVLPRGLAPRASVFAEPRAGLLHFGSQGLKWSAMPVLPRHLLFGRQVCCYYTNGAYEKLAAGPGIAPGWSALQADALLPLPSSVEMKMVPTHGIAPRSSAYRAGALLLSYRGMVKMVA